MLWRMQLSWLLEQESVHLQLVSGEDLQHLRIIHQKVIRVTRAEAVMVKVVASLLERSLVRLVQ